MKTEELKWYTIETPDARSGLEIFCEACSNDLLEHGIMMEVKTENLSNGKRCTSCGKEFHGFL